MKLHKDFSLDTVEMGAAGLRFAEQFEIDRVLAAFEMEMFKVVEETGGMKAKKPKDSPSE